MKSTHRIILLVLVLIIGVVGCSRKKNGFSRRAYHQTTSHYNYYFNANELLKAHVLGIENSYIDDYNYVLPIFYYGTDAQATSGYDNMEEIIKKCSRLIDRHSMYIKNEEYNRWIDDSYLLVGKAKFYKREYYGAIEVLEYVTFAYAGEPAYYEAKIWLARTYMQMEDLRETEDILESVKEVDIPQESKAEYYALYADLNLKKGDMSQAAFYLTTAAENAKDLKIKRRYTFILAQFYHELHDYPNATMYYGKVLKMRPDYRMAFNAKLNQARAYDVSANNSEEIKKRLNRMLKDKKNIEFRDQIYFALAELSFRENDQKQGMEYLKLCAATSVGNNKVKSEAYMLLGNIFYDKPKYVISHAYYDSCLTVMPEIHPKLEETKERKESLDDLVENLLIIQREDSLQGLAKMDEKERDKLISKLIKDAEREDELKSRRLEQSFAMSYETANKRDNSSASAGNWYFYNQSVKSFGVSEFKKVWGNRPNEDNWRRSDKSSMVNFGKEVIDTMRTDSINEGLTNKDPDFYLNQIPLTDSSIAVSHTKIIFALYSAGNIFREDFADYRSSAECFERLVSQYDTCRYVESAYYQLYRIYLAQEEYTKAEQYKRIILDNYPLSEYARIIKNPEYLKNKRDQKQQVEAYYAATYKLYEYKLYDDVIETCEKSDKLFGENHMKAKFDYLKTLAIGKSKSKEQFKMALEDLVAMHPGDDVAIAGQRILDKMNDIVEKKEKREAIYKTNFRDEHVFVIMVPNLSSVVEDVKTVVSNYNINNFGAGKLKLSSVVFDAQNQMISVKNFKDKEDGLLYITNLSKYPDFISRIINVGFSYFIISTENFAFFYQQKNVPEYLSFYNDHYLND